MVAKAGENDTAIFSAAYANNASERRVEYWVQQPDGSYILDETLSQNYSSTSNNLSAKDIDGYTHHAEFATDNSGGWVQDDDMSVADVDYYSFDGHLYRERRNGDSGKQRYRQTTLVPSSGNYEGDGNTSYEVQVWHDEFNDSKTDYGSYTFYNVNDTISIDGHTYTVTSRRNGGRWEWYNYYYSLTCHEDEGYVTETKTVSTKRFYYDRAQYVIEYYYKDIKLNTTDPIFYEASISSGYDAEPSTRPAGVDSDYIWDGWYADAGYGTKFTFDKMPGHNVAL